MPAFSRLIFTPSTYRFSLLITPVSSVFPNLLYIDPFHPLHACFALLEFETNADLVIRVRSFVTYYINVRVFISTVFRWSPGWKRAKRSSRSRGPIITTRSFRLLPHLFPLLLVVKVAVGRESFSVALDTRSGEPAKREDGTSRSEIFRSRGARGSSETRARLIVGGLRTIRTTGSCM